MAGTAYTVDTLGLPSTDPRDIPPNPANDRAKLTLFSVNARNLPGHPTDNRWEQVRHLTGVSYAAVRAKGTALAACRVSVQECRGDADGQDGDDEDWVPVGRGHPLAKAFANPNPRHTLADWLYHWVMQLDLTGTAHTAVREDRLGNPAQFWPLYTHHLQPVPMSPQFPWGGWRVTGWGWGPSGAMGYGQGFGAILGGDEVLSHRYPHPEHSWDGYSPLTAGARHIDVLESIDESRKSVMDQGTRLDGILAVMGLSAGEQADAIRADFQRKHGGSAKHGGTLVVGGDNDAKFFPLNTSAKDIDFTGGWEQLVGAVLALFGVPPIVAGLKQNSSYAELYAAKQQFRDLTLQPLADMIGGFLTKHLVRRHYPDDPLRVVLELPPLGDPEAKRSDIAVSCGNVYTLNEARACMDLDPLDGGDVLASVYEAQQQQAMQPPMGGDPAAAGAAPDGHPLDDVGSAVLEALGASNPGAGGTGAGATNATNVTNAPPFGPVGKALPGTYDEAKHRRDHGKFAKQGGGSRQPQQTQRPQPGAGQGAGSRGDLPPGSPGGNQPATNRQPLDTSGRNIPPQHHARVKAAVQRVAARAAELATTVATRAAGLGLTPESVIGDAQSWMIFAATEHTDAVMHTLGVDHQTAFAVLGHVLGHAVAAVKKHLTNKPAPQGQQPAPVQPGKAGESRPADLQDGPTAGAPPRPDNDEAEGSLPKRPTVKAMGASGAWDQFFAAELAAVTGGTGL